MRLKSLIDRLRSPVDKEQARTVSFVTIEVLNLWAGFARAFYLSCVHEATRESGGRVVVSVPGLDTDAAAIAFSLKVTRVQRRGEPIWHETATLSKLLAAAGASNVAQVLGAISAQPYVFTALPTVRNFFAHRSLTTAQRVTAVARTVGLSVQLRTCDFLCSRLPSRPQNVLADWIDDIRNAIEIACQ